MMLTIIVIAGIAAALGLIAFVVFVASVVASIMCVPEVE